jgi:hypothetical protein
MCYIIFILLFVDTNVSLVIIFLFVSICSLQTVERQLRGDTFHINAQVRNEMLGVVEEVRVQLGEEDVARSQGKW